MWMMGYNDGCEMDNMVSDHSFNSRKLRPLIPKPSSCISSNSINTNRMKATEFFALNHHHVGAEQNKRELMNSQPVVASTRWNPTPEQLRALEDLYRRGTRTPSADQIQQITVQLRRYGKIEGKNVFYWFQNHKARERQKRRRQMEENPDQEQNLLQEKNLERKDTGSSKTVYEEEQSKNRPPSTNFNTLPEESVSRSRAATKSVMTERRRDRWVQISEEELIDRRDFLKRNATWQTTMMHQKTKDIATLVNKYPFATATTQIVSTKAQNLQSDEEQHINGDSQTLQLFPLRSVNGEDESYNIKKQRETVNCFRFDMNHQFYEFLPLKN